MDKEILQLYLSLSPEDKQLVDEKIHELLVAQKKGAIRMNELQVFNSPEFGNIRTVEIDGQPWLVGKDVARALGYVNTKDALAKHVDQEDRRGSQITTPSGEQNMTVINESGLYSLVLSSKLPGRKSLSGGLHRRYCPPSASTGAISRRRWRKSWTRSPGGWTIWPTPSLPCPGRPSSRRYP